MRNRVLLSATIAFVLAFLSGARGQHASACVCSPIDPFWNLHDSDAAFAGVLLAWYDRSGLAEFRVSGVWKGDVDETEVVEVVGAGTSCEFDLDEGEAYLVFASRGDPAGSLLIGLCGVAPLAWAEEHLELAVLGTPQPPGIGPIIPMLPLPEPPGTGARTPDASKPAGNGPKAALLAAVTLVLTGAGFIARGNRVSGA